MKTVDTVAGFVGFSELVTRVAALPGDRSIVAIAGPPGAGKSTLAQALVDDLNDQIAGTAEVIPMDGFHYDDAVLTAWGLLARKGAPQTFDIGGFISLLERLRRNAEPHVAVPVFDRGAELSRAGARIVLSETRILVAEGNYLLLDDPKWTPLRPFFDMTVMLREDQITLRNRLIARWRSFGIDEAEANAKTMNNDLPNADLVLHKSVLAQIEIRSLTLQKDINP
jgi:pantothenate kinase